MNSTTKPKVILFDVNETLLDMTPVKKKVNSVLDSKRGFRIWFGMLLQYSLVDNCTGDYHDFTQIGGAALQMAAAALEEEIDEDEKAEVLTLMNSLEPYPDVEEGLQQLKDAGFRLATLTNSTQETQLKQMQTAKLEKYFEALLSVDAVRKYKPASESYHYAVQTLGVAPQDVLLVAAHSWDIAGATAAGMHAAFIKRKGQSLYPLAPLPAFEAKNLTDLATQLQSSK